MRGENNGKVEIHLVTGEVVRGRILRTTSDKLILEVAIPRWQVVASAEVSEPLIIREASET